MKISNLAQLKPKDLIVFDLDGTLTPSKSWMRRSVALLLARLLAQKKVAVIGGGKYEQFQEQFLAHLACPKPLLKNLFLFPTTSTSMYRYANGWKKVYAHELAAREKRKIFRAFAQAFHDVGYAHPKITYGKVIEDRGTQITFSALGQDIVSRLGDRGIRIKEEWGRSGWREKIALSLSRRLPEFEVRRGGLTSIDVTHKGIDKAYGIREIEKQLRIPIKSMLFVGDAIYPGGNDYAAVKTGTDYVQVSGPQETARLMRRLLSAGQ